MLRCKSWYFCPVRRDNAGATRYWMGSWFRGTGTGSEEVARQAPLQIQQRATRLQLDYAAGWQLKYVLR